MFETQSNLLLWPQSLKVLINWRFWSLYLWICDLDLCTLFFSFLFVCFLVFFCAAHWISHHVPKHQKLSCVFFNLGGGDIEHWSRDSHRLISSHKKETTNCCCCCCCCCCCDTLTFRQVFPTFRQGCRSNNSNNTIYCPHVQTPNSNFQNQNIQNSKIQTPKSKLQKSRLRNPKSKIKKSKFQIQLPPTTKGLTYTTIVDLSKVYNGPRTISDPTLLRTLGFRYFRPLVVEGMKMYPINIAWCVH